MNKDTVSGIIVFVVSIFAGYYAWQYQIGIASNMGPGYYPLLLSVVLVILGLILIINSKWK